MIKWFKTQSREALLFYAAIIIIFFGLFSGDTVPEEQSIKEKVDFDSTVAKQEGSYKIYYNSGISGLHSSTFEESKQFINGAYQCVRKPKHAGFIVDDLNNNKYVLVPCNIIRNSIIFYSKNLQPPKEED
jgi:hypothetical protein